MQSVRDDRVGIIAKLLLFIYTKVSITQNFTLVAYIPVQTEPHQRKKIRYFSLNCDIFAARLKFNSKSHRLLSVLLLCRNISRIQPAESNLLLKRDADELQSSAQPASD